MHGGGSALAATDPPLQVQFYVAKTQSDFPNNPTRDIVRTYRMANNGSTQLARITGQFVAQGGSVYDAFAYDPSAQTPFTLLARDGSTAIVSARCATNAGYIGGELDLSSTTPAAPTWWLNNGAHNRVLDDDNIGTFWDVTEASGSNNECYFAGYFQSGSGNTDKKAVRYRRVTDEKVFPTSPNYIGSEAMGINKDLDMCGMAYASGVTAPVVWQWSGSAYTMVDLTTKLGWYTGRSGYLIGITDRKVADNLGPYALGYMYSSGSSNDGQVFIYSVGAQTFRFLGTTLGPPEQISNRDYDASDPVVSFVGNSPIPYIWVGSPNGDSAYAHNGSEHDIWAFLDAIPNPKPISLEPTHLTGINRHFAFGGYRDNSGLAQAPDGSVSTSVSTNWFNIHDTRITTVVRGSVTGGDADHMSFADGKFVNILRAPITPLFPKDPWIIIDVQETVSSVPILDQMRLRFTARQYELVDPTITIFLWNYDTGTWTSLGQSELLPKTYMTSAITAPVAMTFEGGYHNPYINGSGQMKARITVERTSPFGSSWSLGFEQISFLGDPH